MNRRFGLTGYRNLVKLTSISHLRGMRGRGIFSRACVDKQLLLRDAKSSGVLVEEVTWARLGQLTGGAVHQGIVLQTAAAETFDLEDLPMSRNMATAAPAERSALPMFLRDWDCNSRLHWKQWLSGKALFMGLSLQRNRTVVTAQNTVTDGPVVVAPNRTGKLVVCTCEVSEQHTAWHG